jgi:hypothetical protein
MRRRSAGESGRSLFRLCLSGISLLVFSLFLLKLIRLHKVSPQSSYYLSIHLLSLILTVIFFRRFIASVLTIYIDKVADLKYTQHTLTACGRTEINLISNLNNIIFAFAKLRKATISFVMSVCPHATTPLPLDGF